MMMMMIMMMMIWCMVQPNCAHCKMRIYIKGYMCKGIGWKTKLHIAQTTYFV